MRTPLIKHVQEPWFGFIKSGEKTIEGRLNKGSFQTLKNGDEVHWTNPDQEGDNIIKTEVVSIHYHNDFQNMLKVHQLSNVLPGVKTYEEGIGIYSNFYCLDDIEKYGVIAIKIKKI